MRYRLLATTFAVLMAAVSTSCATLRGDLAEEPVEDLQQFEVGTTDSENAQVTPANSPDAFAQAFAFSGTELFSEAPVSGSDLYSLGPMVVTFVSPNCEISTDQAAEMAKVAETLEEVTFVFVHSDGEKSDYEEFVETADLFQQNVVHLNDTDRALANRFNVKIHPSSVLVDANGKILFTTGGLDEIGVADVVNLVTQNT